MSSLTFTEAVVAMSPAARAALDAVAAQIPRVPIPAIQLPNEDYPDLTVLSWSYAGIYADIEISPEGYGWFARELLPGADDDVYAGSEEAGPIPLPPEAVPWLHRISKRPSDV